MPEGYLNTYPILITYQIRRYEMTNGPGKGLIVVGGIGGIIWLVGAILTAFLGTVAAIGYIVIGIGALIGSFGGVGFWQRTKDFLTIFTFVMGLIGGILLLVGGALAVAGIVVSVWIIGIGQALFGIFLIVLGLVIHKLGSQLSTQASLGMDLVFPAVITSIAGGCAVLGALPSVTAPAGIIVAILFFVTK